jgi:hypothetical protein
LCNMGLVEEQGGLFHFLADCPIQYPRSNRLWFKLRRKYLKQLVTLLYNP